MNELSNPLISPIKKIGNIIYLSGKTAEGNDTGIQTRNIFEEIKNILKDNDSSIQNIVAATVYLTDINERPKYFNPIWREYFPVNPPTRTCVEVGLAPPSRVEVTVIATITDKNI